MPEEKTSLTKYTALFQQPVRYGEYMSYYPPLPLPAEMNEWDNRAKDMGLMPFALMENAAREALAVLASAYGCLEGAKVLLFMGSGNNGGDAAALARHLLDAQAEVLVVHSRPLAKYSGITKQHLTLAKRCGVAFQSAQSWLTAKGAPAFVPHIVVDGLLGTGLGGNVREAELALIQQINLLAAGSFVLALDIPSGLSGSTGEPMPEAVRAKVTVTFEAAKPGLVLPNARPWVGDLHVRPIGIPRVIRSLAPASWQLISSACVRAVPQPRFDWHKGRAGHVLIVGGSEGLMGAPMLAAKAALRSGCGLVTHAAPKGCFEQCGSDWPDIMRLPLPGNEWNHNQLEAVFTKLEQCAALVLGPGIGRSVNTVAFVQRLLQHKNRPAAVVDADALHALTFDASSDNGFACLRSDDVITPHPGEAARLLGTTSAQIQADRFAALHALMEKSPAVCLLKGAGTLVGQKGKVGAISPHANPCLAVAGSGDVLSGCIGALLAQGIEGYDAACAAVQLHAMAGSFMAKTYPLRGNTASQLADALPLVYQYDTV